MVPDAPAEQKGREPISLRLSGSLSVGHVGGAKTSSLLTTRVDAWTVASVGPGFNSRHLHPRGPVAWTLSSLRGLLASCGCIGHFASKTPLHKHICSEEVADWVRSLYFCDVLLGRLGERDLKLRT